MIWPEVIAFFEAAGALILQLMTLPWLPYAIGAGVGGYAAGASKNRSALGELARAAFYGAVAGGAVWMLQFVLLTGGA